MQNQKYARIQDATVAETVDFNPAGLYHESLVWVPCPNDVGQNWHYDGTGFTPPEVVPPVEPDPSGLVYAKAAKVAEAAAACDAALAPLASRFGQLEPLTWNKQLAEAKALLADPGIAATSAEGAVDPIPTIRGITVVTGEGIPEFAAAVLKNDEDWTRISAYVIGRRQAICAQVNAVSADDPDALAKVAAIDVTITLPG